jgi:hypothetical protein
MRYLWIFLLSLSFVVGARSAASAEYVIDFGLVTDLEDLRELVDLCTDLGPLERYRKVLEATSDLESRRQLLERVGIAEVRGCPGVERIDGVTRLTTKAKPRSKPDPR